MNGTKEDSPQLQMRNLMMSFVMSRALQVAAELGLADALADGPKHRDALARDVGADAGTMSRLIRALASFGVFKQLADGRVANTAQSECLRSDAPGSLRELACMYGSSAMWQAWTGLEHSIRRGEPAFKHVHGLPVFEYLAQHAGSARRFDNAMAASSRLMNEALVEAYDWSRIGTLVDVAGGVGSTLAAVLQAYPGVRGVLFDLPHVTERARDHLTRQGLEARCQVVSGSFFDTVPPGADAYFMKHIIHDWNDEDCLRILSNCRAAMSEHAKLLVCEKLIAPDDKPSVAKTLDLVMLVMTDGGRERTEPEFRALFARAGLRLARVVTTQVDNCILEVVR